MSMHKAALNVTFKKNYAYDLCVIPPNYFENQK